MLGLIVLVAAGLLLLALVSYTPSDPSFNTVGGGEAGGWLTTGRGWWGRMSRTCCCRRLGSRSSLCRWRWCGLAFRGCGRSGWGRPKAKLAGIALWLMFAPALIALMPGQLLWRHALPIAGIEGTILAGGLIHFVNLSGRDDSLQSDGGAVAVPDDVVSAGECGRLVHGVTSDFCRA